MVAEMKATHKTVNRTMHADIGQKDHNRISASDCASQPTAVVGARLGPAVFAALRRALQ